MAHSPPVRLPSLSSTSRQRIVLMMAMSTLASAPDIAGAQSGYPGKPISLIAIFPGVLIVNNALPVKSTGMRID